MWAWAWRMGDGKQWRRNTIEMHAMKYEQMFGVIDQGTPARPLHAPSDWGAAVLDVMGVQFAL